MCNDLSFINTTQKTLKTSKKIVSIPRRDEKKLHTWEFQLKGISRNMRCKLLQKRSTEKTTECSKHLRHIATEKDIFSKLVIPKILLILVLCSLTSTSKLRDSPQQNYPSPQYNPPSPK